MGILEWIEASATISLLFYVGRKHLLRTIVTRLTGVELDDGDFENFDVDEIEV